MIYELLSNFEQYKILTPQAMGLLAARLPELDAQLHCGKEVLIEDKLFILIQRYNSRPADTARFETHSDFIDLQMLLDGEEKVYYAPSAGLECTSVYNPDADYALYQADLAHAAQFILKPGNFAVFLPEEAHLPSCGNGEAVVKAVVKIHKSLLNG